MLAGEGNTNGEIISMLVYSFIYLFIVHIDTQQICMELLSDSGHMETYKPWFVPSGAQGLEEENVKKVFCYNLG